MTLRSSSTTSMILLINKMNRMTTSLVLKLESLLLAKASRSISLLSLTSLRKKSHRLPSPVHLSSVCPKAVGSIKWTLLRAMTPPGNSMTLRESAQLMTKSSLKKKLCTQVASNAIFWITPQVNKLRRNKSKNRSRRFTKYVTTCSFKILRTTVASTITLKSSKTYIQAALSGYSIAHQTACSLTWSSTTTTRSLSSLLSIS